MLALSTRKGHGDNVGNESSYSFAEGCQYILVGLFFQCWNVGDQFLEMPG